MRRVFRNQLAFLAIIAMVFVGISTPAEAKSFPTVTVRVGKTVTYANGMSIVVNSLKNPSVSIKPSILKPKSGFRFVTAHLTFHMRGSSTYRPYLQGTLFLRTRAAVTYGPDASGIGVTDCPDAGGMYSVVVIPKLVTRACVIFQIPIKTPPTMVVFSPPNSSTAIWRI